MRTVSPVVTSASWSRPPRAVAALAFLAALASGAALGRAEAASLKGVRIAEVAKDHVTLDVALDAPGAVTVRYGEAPMAWSSSADSAAAAERHEVMLSGLVPDRQYFYQVEVDGAPAGEILALRSGRSWASRDATVLVAAGAGGDAAAEEALAARLFAQPSDVLVLIGDDGSHANGVATLHARTLAERLTLSASLPGEPVSSFADVTLAVGPGAATATPARESCWLVAENTPTADVVLARGVGGVDVRDGKLFVGLGAGQHARIKFAGGEATATVHDAAGTEVDRASLRKDCKTPEPTAQLQVFGADEGEPGSSEIDIDTSDCD